MFRARSLCLIVFTGLAAALFADSDKDIGLTLLGRHVSGALSTSNPGNPNELAGAEIAAYDPISRRLFITNAFHNTLDIVSIADPSNPTEVDEIDLDLYGAIVNSVSVRNGVVAVAVEASPKTANGKVAFFNTNGDELAVVTVGALPDMLTFTPDGRAVLVANEGEPSTYVTPGNDPEGSVSIIRLPEVITTLSQSDVTTVRFTAFNGTALDPSIRIFGPNASVAQDLEPEYIAVSDDSRTAWVTLQENNAIAELDIESATFVRLLGLGTKDHSAQDFGLDGSDEDGPGTGSTSRRFHVANWPVQGMYHAGRDCVLSDRGTDLPAHRERRRRAGLARHDCRDGAVVHPGGLSPDLRGLSRRCEWHPTVDGVEDRRQSDVEFHRPDSTAAGPWCALVLDLDDRRRAGLRQRRPVRADHRGEVARRTPSTPTTAAISTGTRAAMTRDRNPRGSPSPNCGGDGMPSSRSNASAASWFTTSPIPAGRGSSTTSTAATSPVTPSPTPLEISVRKCPS